jgi:two-component system OmpR family sensor kinase
MKQLLDSLAIRISLILLLSLGLFHIASLYLYQTALTLVADEARDSQLAERLVSIKQAIAEQHFDLREETAHGLSTAALDIHWSESSLINTSQTNDPTLADFHSKLLTALPGALKETEIRLGYAAEAQQAHHAIRDLHVIYVSLQIADGSWVNYAITRFSHPASASHGTIFSTSIMALGIILASFWVVRLFSRPLQKLAEASSSLAQNLEAPPLPVAGPREVREAAAAFNSMQSNIRELIKNRTLMLAAISHDLRTPLTRMRLRNEFIPDAALRAKNEQDIIEMEQMLESALAYLRSEQNIDRSEKLDLNQLLQQTCLEYCEAGKAVTYSGAESVVLQGNAQELKRAVCNLIDNALKYGNGARVELTQSAQHVVVSVTDSGPGIHPDQWKSVMTPFVQLDPARRAHGSGLGLSIVSNIAKSHGAKLAFARPESGGFTVKLTFTR